MKELSAERILANRTNAKKGGVKSNQGKAISKKNAMKHGVLSLMKTQYEELEFERLYLELATEFKVETTSQKLILEQLVSCYIKLTRCLKFETKISLKKIGTDLFPELDDLDGTSDEEEDDPSIERKFVFDQKAFEVLEPILLRYEPMLIRRMLFLIKELRVLSAE